MTASPSTPPSNEEVTPPESDERPQRRASDTNRKIQRLERRLARERAARRMAEDVSEAKLRGAYLAQREAERSAEMAQEASVAKSAFLANMSHELRTPLNGVIGMTSLLTDTELDVEQREFVSVIRASGQTLLTVINDILDFSKIEAGRLDLERYPFEIRAMVADSLDLASTFTSEKGIELTYEVGDSVPQVLLGDAVRIRQVLDNLISNAGKFTHEGEIVVTVRAKEVAVDRHRIYLSVRDTGIGIKAHRVDSLFESFQQADVSTTRTYGGTGLGLTISLQLAEMMGGTIKVTSEYGTGSTFTVELVLDSVDDGNRPSPTEALACLAGRYVLIVDDNATNLRILERQLAKWDMRCLVASSGAGALEQLDELKRVDLAILDMQMPEMDGSTLALELRKLDLPRFPIALLTSLGRREDGDDVFAAQMSKPVHPSSLQEVLVGLLQHQVATAAKDKDETGGIPNLAKTKPMKILLAEDNAVNQKVATALLDRLGYKIEVVPDGRQAVVAATTSDFDLILMDVQMPNLDGLAATKAIRAILPDDRQPWIIALTANAFAEDRAASREAGMQDHLAKPIQLEELIEALKRVGST